MENGSSVARSRTHSHSPFPPFGDSFRPWHSSAPTVDASPSSPACARRSPKSGTVLKNLTRHRARQAVRRRADSAHGARRQATSTRSSTARSCRRSSRRTSRAKSRCCPMLPKGVRGVHGGSRVRVGEPGDHRRGRPDRARSPRRRHRRRRRVAVERADPAFARACRTSSSRCRKRRRSAQRLGDRRLDPAARPRADHAGDRRAVDRRVDGPERPRRWRRSITSRARSRISSRCARIGSPPSALEDGRLTAEIAPVWVPPKYEHALTTDNGIRAGHEHRAAARAEAGVRPTYGIGDRGQLVAAHRRRERGAADERREGASRSATRRSPTFDRTRTPRSIRASSCSWVRCSPRRSRSSARG